MAPKTWLITGCTSGVGAGLVKAVAARGDNVIATGRNGSVRMASIAGPSVKLLELDVTSPLSEIQTQIGEAVKLFGGIDVLVNNAGMTGLSNIEEADEKFVQTIFDVNLFGPMKVTQAALPYMREAKKGTIAFIGAGFTFGAMPFVTHYAMTKTALSMFAEGLAKEVKPFNIKSVILELGAVPGTDLGKPRGVPADTPPVPHGPKIPDYAPQFGELLSKMVTEVHPSMACDLEKVPNVIVDVLKSEGVAAGRGISCRVILGPDTLDVARQRCKEQLQLSDTWEDVSLAVMKVGKRETAPFMLKSLSLL